MKFCLLSSPPLVTIHIIYQAQVQGLKFADVVIVGDGGQQYNLLREYARSDRFNLHFIEDPNSNEGLALMKAIAPDVLAVNVLNILRKPILEIPKVATVNIHTGILPQYRGLESRRWAILEGGQVGVSAHLVDEGLDTGEILIKRELELQPGDTIETVTSRNYYTNKWQVFIEALLKVKRGEVKGIKQQLNEGKQYFIMHPKLAKVVDLILESRENPSVSSKSTNKRKHMKKNCELVQGKANRWLPASALTWCDGRQGFETYFEHVTKFRRAVSKLVDRAGGKAILKMCDVSHPATPENITNVVESALSKHINSDIQTSLIKSLKIKEHQPQQAREAIAAILNQRIESAVSESEVLILYGSSMQWLDIVFRQAIVKSLHDDFQNYGYAKQPIVLAPAGSFKCGGYFPHANGSKIHYINTQLSNNYKLTADLLDQTIQEVEADGSKKVVCFVLETPTALGQNFTKPELFQIAQVLAQYPHILWLQDGYNLGTEHDGILNPSLADCSEIAMQGCTISSFRRDWGGAATIANVSAFHTFNQLLLNEISKQCSETYFYTHLPFSEAQLIVTNAIAEAMKNSSFPQESQIYFKQQLAEYAGCVEKTNDHINKILGTQNVKYIYTIKPQAGQFGFLFFNKGTTDKSGATSSTKIAELMCLYEGCRVMPTLLDPMGIGKDPVGIRINVAMSKNPEKNLQIIHEALDRIGNTVIQMEKGLISYNQFAPLAEKLRKYDRLDYSDELISKMGLQPSEHQDLVSQIN